MQTQRRFSTAPLFAGMAALAALAAAGCGGNPIVGKWDGTLTVHGLSAQAVVEFKADGTETQTFTAMGMTLVYNSTYKTDNGTLTQTIVSATMGGKPFPAPGVNQTQTLQYKIDGDTLTTTLPGSPAAVVLKREAQ